MSHLSLPSGPFGDAARIDAATGLSNALHLLQAIESAQGSALAPPLAVLCVDVPRVAELGATMGPQVGDALAQVLADRLTALCREDAVVAHLGGGEFGVLLVAPPGRDQLAQRAARLRQVLQQPAAVQGVDVYPQCRVGVAAPPLGTMAPRALIGAAQAACRTVAPAGGVAFHEAASTALALRALQLEAALRRALDAGEFTLAYQPQLDLAQGRIVGVEALLRWHSPTWGTVPVPEFMPLAERSGLIVALGDWVFRQACEQAVRWRREGLPALRLAVNISPVQLQLGDVARSVRAALADTGADPAVLALELTETALQHDPDRVVATLQSLRDLGIEIVLDDFGTGASSLSSLRRLPVGLVKIDRSFIADLTVAPDSAAVARSVVQLTHALRLPVLAEGVETEGQLAMLQAMGCDRIQGHLYSPPVAEAEMTALLRADRRLPLAAPRAPAAARTLLLVDDEPGILASLRRLFRADGYRVLTATSGAQGLELLATHPVDVIVSDQRMPGMTGVEFLRRTKALHPDTVRMTLSGYTDLQSIIDAVNEGAVYKFLTKPWDDERLRAHVAQAFELKGLSDENRRLHGQLAASHAEQAAMNMRLELLLARQREQAQLMQDSAGGVRDLVDALPAAVIGLDPDGLLAFLNRRAAELLPDALAHLGGDPGPQIQALRASLRGAAAGEAGPGQSVLLGQRPHRAWLGRLAPERGELLVLLADETTDA